MSQLKRSHDCRIIYSRFTNSRGLKTGSSVIVAEDNIIRDIQTVVRKVGKDGEFSHLAIFPSHVQKLLHPSCWAHELLIKTAKIKAHNILSKFAGCKLAKIHKSGICALVHANLIYQHLFTQARALSTLPRSLALNQEHCYLAEFMRRPARVHVGMTVPVKEGVLSFKYYVYFNYLK